MKKQPKKNREQQGELAGMPEKAPFVIKAEELLDLIEENEELYEKIKAKKKEVLEELIKANRNDIYLRERTISRETLVKDTVVVKKKRKSDK